MKALSLFANVGLSEVYLPDLGVDVVVANELISKRCEFYRQLHPSTNMIEGNITNDKIKKSIVNASKDEGIDLIIATPPCQGMSLANPTASESFKKNSDKHDARNSLICHAMDIFNEVLPQYMLIENVRGMTKAYISVDGEPVLIIDYIKSRLPEGYELEWKILNAKDFDTPQSRARFIGLISKGGKWKHPKANTKEITVRDAIGHLPSLESGETSEYPWHFGRKHCERHIRWLKHTPTGETAFNNKEHYPQKDGRKIRGFKSTYARLWWDRPSTTITMNNGDLASQSNGHPGRPNGDGTYSDARAISVMEAAILCGLPHDFFDPYFGVYSESLVRKVIGECFPPKMSREIIRSIAE